MTNGISPQVVTKVAHLANLTVTDQEVQALTTSFSATLDEVNKLLELDLTTTQPTHQVTGLVNTWREDVVDADRQFSADQALSQTPHRLQNWVVVDRILESSV